MMLIKSVSGIVDPLACLHQNPSRGVFTLQTVVPLCNDPNLAFSSRFSRRADGSIPE